MEMRITPYGRFVGALITLCFILALGVGRGGSGMLLVAAGFFLLVYENMRRPLIEQGLRRTPWLAPLLTVDGDTVTIESLMAPRSVRLSDVVRARLVYQESFDALVGIDDTLTLELATGVLQVPRSAVGFDTLLQHLRLAGIGVRMVRARMAID